MPAAKAKKKVGGQPGKRNPQMRGSQRKDRTAKVLSQADHPKIIEELRRFAPLCTIAQKLNVSRHTLERYVHSVPELEQEYIDKDESMVDLIERSMFDAAIGNVRRDERGRIIQINVNSGAFFLERKGKQRGYSQHVEIAHGEVPSFTFSRRDSDVKADRKQ